jgi:phage terminase small subunit
MTEELTERNTSEETGLLEQILGRQYKAEQFCRELMADPKHNAAQAAIRAGCDRKFARQRAWEWLHEPSVQARLRDLRDQKIRQLDVSANGLLGELACLAFANMQDYLTIDTKGDPHVDLGALTRAQAAAIQEIVVEEFMEGRGKDARPVRRTKFKLHDKKGALEDLCRHLGLFEKDNAQRPATIQPLIVMFAEPPAGAKTVVSVQIPGSAPEFEEGKDAAGPDHV